MTTASKADPDLPITIRTRVVRLLGFIFMTGRRKKKDSSAVSSKGEAGDGQSQKRPATRFTMRLYPDRSMRPERVRTRAQSDKDQMMADYMGAPRELSPNANMRTMDSILAEILEDLDLQDAEFAPQVLADAWLKAVGPFLASMSELQSIARQKARISTTHPAVKFELQRMRVKIAQVLNATLGEGSVRYVQIVHG